MHARLLKHLPGRARAGSGAPGRPTGHAVGCSPRYYIRGDSAYPAAKGGVPTTRQRGRMTPPMALLYWGGGGRMRGHRGAGRQPRQLPGMVPTPQHLLKNRPKICKLGYRPQRPYHGPRPSPTASQPSRRLNEAPRRPTPYGMAVPYSRVWLFGNFSSKNPKIKVKSPFFHICH